MPQPNFVISEPNLDGTIHFAESNGTSWGHYDIGPGFRLPSFLNFSLDSMEIDNTRSIHNDTDIVAMSYAAGRWPIQPNGITPGDVNNGVHPLEVTFNPVPVELCEPVAFVYSIVNSGNTDVSGSAMAAMQKGGEDYLNDRIKSLVNPDSDAVVTGLTILQTIGGSLLGAGAGVLLDAWLNLMSGKPERDASEVSLCIAERSGQVYFLIGAETQESEL
jgi:hypothetical protein